MTDPLYIKQRVPFSWSMNTYNLYVITYILMTTFAPISQVSLIILNTHCDEISIMLPKVAQNKAK